MVNAEKYSKQATWTCSVPGALIKTNNIAFTVEKLINDCFTSKMEKSIFANGNNKQYSARDIFKAITFANIEDHVSSSKIIDSCIHDERYQMLMDSKVPDDSTIRKYFNAYKIHMMEIHSNILKVAKKIGMSNFDTASLDSSIFKAQNNQFHRLTLKGIDQLIEVLLPKNEEELKEYLETKAHEELKRPQRKFLNRKVTIHRKLEDLHKMRNELIESGKEYIPLYDTDARLTKNKKKGYYVGYYDNYMVDIESMLIVDIEVNNEMTDNHQVGKMLNRYNEIMGFYPKKLLCDKGFNDHEALVNCDEKDVDIYTPTLSMAKEANGNKSQNPFNLENNTLDWDSKCVNCFLDVPIPRVRTNWDKGQQRNYFHGPLCNECICAEFCPTPKSTEFVFSGNHLEINLIEKMESENGQITYSDRPCTVELAIASTKKDFSFDKTQYKGLDNVQIDAFFKIIAYNIKKIHKFLQDQKEEEKRKKEEKLSKMSSEDDLINTEETHQSKLEINIGLPKFITGGVKEAPPTDNTVQSHFLV